MRRTVYRRIFKVSLAEPLFALALITLMMFLFFLNNGLHEVARPYAPPGQSLYVLSKATALLVYVLMWWQIMSVIFKRVNVKLHIILGTSLFLLITLHMVLFIAAVSIRQGELHMGALLPDFTIGYYETGVSVGVFAFLLMLLATVASTLRKRLGKYWKYGHALVYFSFLLATIHGLMIGSDINSGLFSYVVYGAVFSLVIAFLYKKTSLFQKI